MIGSSSKNPNSLLIPGIGPKTAEKLSALGLNSLEDCLWYFPHSYEDRSRIVPIGSLLSGQSALIYGKIIDIQLVYRPKPRLNVFLQDVSGICTVTFFHYTKQYVARFQKGDWWRCFGTPYLKKNNWMMAHPESTQKIDGEPWSLPDTFCPIYPTTAGVSQALLQKVITYAIQQRAFTLPELLPPDLAKTFSYTISEALQWIHRPSLDVSINQLADRRHPAFVRLITEELLAHQFAAVQKKHQFQQETAHSYPLEALQHTLFLSNLPFKLTSAQQKVWTEISQDLHSHKPMVRLLQGDVGSGKTVIAALTLFSAIQAGKQAALMVPTEVLALQHYQCFKAWAEPLGVQIGFLGGLQTARERKAALSDIESHKAHLVIGTHALFQNKVQFHALGCIVIDEQHRFGVEQRWALLEKGRHQGHIPHQLIMTATPIPRTLKMALYGEMDVSIIDEIPPGRQPITTSLLSDAKRTLVMERLQQWGALGRQSYWICPLIEESEQLQCQAAEKTYLELQTRLPTLRIGLIHGRLTSSDKQKVMEDFHAHLYDILVATTVIEVGIDVPNASLIVIDNPDRLGLAQLHQLRGRVGRGTEASHCLLVYPATLSVPARMRLQILKDSQDGFWIAEKDFELRGPGEWLGTKQSGLASYKIANLQKDVELLAKAHKIALASSVVWDFEPLLNRWLGEKQRYHLI